MHQTYILPGVVDGAVAHKQAQDRLRDKRNGSQETIVHEHAYRKPCNDKCTRYHICITTKEPGSHPLADPCPIKEENDGN